MHSHSPNRGGKRFKFGCAKMLLNKLTAVSKEVNECKGKIAATSKLNTQAKAAC